MLPSEDIVAWSLFALVVVAYHAIMYTNVLVRHKSTAQLSWMLANSPAWIAKMLRTKSSEVAAVQTLRNTIIVSTFVGGFAFTNATLYIDQLQLSSSSDGVSNDQARIIVLAILLYVAFLNFALVVRSSAHVGYLVTSAAGQAEAAAQAATVAASTAPAATAAAMPPAPHDAENGQHVADTVALWQDVSVVSDKMLRIVTLHFSLGFRMFYVAIPVALYAAGAPVFIGATVLLLAWLLYVDHGAALM